MDSSQLTRDQRHKLLMAVADRRDYFGKLKERMEATGWPPDDPLFVAVRKAWDAAQELVMAVFEREEKPAPPEWVRRMGG
jgi:hypothetical protein